jgi:hypothetical protein
MIGTDVRPHCLESSFSGFLGAAAFKLASGMVGSTQISSRRGVTDASAQADLWVRSDLDISASTQYELWNVPVLSPSSQQDVATSVQMTLHPKWSK